MTHFERNVSCLLGCIPLCQPVGFLPLSSVTITHTNGWSSLTVVGMAGWQHCPIAVRKSGGWMGKCTVQNLPGSLVSTCAPCSAAGWVPSLLWASASSSWTGENSACLWGLWGSRGPVHEKLLSMVPPTDALKAASPHPGALWECSWFCGFTQVDLNLQ